MKNKKIYFKICIAVLLLIMAIVVSINVQGINKEYVELTQLKDNSSSQMMGYFIRTSTGKNIVVDGGTSADYNNLQEFINNNGGKVDYWFITHYHADHTGALVEIINNTNIPISMIIYREVPKNMVEQYEPNRIDQYNQLHDALQNERVKENIKNPEKGQIFEISNKINIKTISVYENDITENFGNNTSSVYKFFVNEQTILFLGDTGAESSEKLLKNNRDELKSDYVQMSHHGQNGATFELYKEINPQYCLWPTPKWLWDNDIGQGYNTGPFKTVETREWMNSLNVKQHYIEKDGNQSIIIGK